MEHNNPLQYNQIRGIHLGQKHHINILVSSNKPITTKRRRSIENLAKIIRRALVILEVIYRNMHALTTNELPRAL